MTIVQFKRCEIVILLVIAFWLKSLCQSYKIIVLVKNGHDELKHKWVMCFNNLIFSIYTIHTGYALMHRVIREFYYIIKNRKYIFVTLIHSWSKKHGRYRLCQNNNIRLAWINSWLYVCQIWLLLWLNCTNNKRLNTLWLWCLHHKYISNVTNVSRKMIVYLTNSRV